MNDESKPWGLAIEFGGIRRYWTGGGIFPVGMEAPVWDDRVSEARRFASQDDANAARKLLRPLAAGQLGRPVLAVELVEEWGE